MNSSNGKASTNASKQNYNNSRQSTKSQTNGRSTINNHNKNNYNNNNNQKSSSRGNGNSGRFDIKKSHRNPLNIGSIVKSDRSTIRTQGLPEMDGIVEFDEFVADILGSGGLATTVITKYAFNPGQTLLFPLGSAESAKWTNWKCISATPYLDHEVSEFATDGSTGKIYLAFDYNAANALPTTKQQLADMHHSCCMPCEDISLPLITKKLNRADPKYIRTGPQPNGTDIRLYDGGNLYVGVIGQAGTTKVSELHIRYKFAMELKTLLNPTGLLTTGDTSMYQRAASETFTNTVAAPLQFDVATFDPNSQIGPPSTGVFTPSAGVYLFSFSGTFYDTSSEAFTASVYMYKNGAALTKPVTSIAYSSTGNYLNVNFQAIVSCNGTDTVQIEVVLDGAAGTLTAAAGMSELIISPA